jgi:uncharacterized protein
LAELTWISLAILALVFATVQPLWLVVSPASFGSKWAIDAGQLPGLPWWAWLGSVGAIVGGMYAGEWVQWHMNEVALRRAVTVVTLLGGILALGMGIRALAG